MQNRPSRPAFGLGFSSDRQVLMSVCQSVDTPRSLCVYLLAQADEWGQYLNLPMPDTSQDSFPDDYLVTEMLRKHKSLPGLQIDTARVAKDKFLAAEIECQKANARIQAYHDGSIFDPELNEVLNKATRLISGILGPLTRKKLAYAEDHFGFGPGATSAVSGRNVLLSRKMTCSMHVTPRLYPYWKSILGPAWGREVDDIALRSYSKVITVPKNSKTDRCICVEPHLNIFVQKGFGALIRRQLLLSGLDLNTQVNNQLLASKARDLQLATIDLSSASDCICRELVWSLLPLEWAALLDTARTEYVELDGKEIRLEKFSAMGNGFTFELESLIFWALARACGDESSLCYGDDIITLADCAPKLIRVLEFLGFKTNAQKSFLAGDFYESCGSDWWRGQNVRPFYLKGDNDDIQDVLVLRNLNAVSRYASRRGNGIYRDVRLLPAWLRLYSRLSHKARGTFIPDGFGDDAIVKDFDECVPSCVRDHETLIGYRARRLSGSRPYSSRTSGVGAYLAALAWGSPEGVERSHEYERGIKPTARRLSTLVVPEWSDLGPWY